MAHIKQYWTRLTKEGPWWGNFIRILILISALLSFGGSFFLNYAASGGLFILALLGLFIGLSQGFSTTVTRQHFMVGIAFSFALLAAIISFSFGLQTPVGFRMLGRLLRFMLFIPIISGLNWARLKLEHVVIAGTLGSLGTLGVAVAENMAGGIPTGVTGTHIVFGDGALLLGIVTAILSLGSNNFNKTSKVTIASLAFLSGISASFLSGARGGWIAIPILLILLIFQTDKLRKRLLIGTVFSGLLLLPFLVPRITHILKARYAAAIQQFDLYSAGIRNWSNHCPNSKDVLNGLLESSGLIGHRAYADVIETGHLNAKSRSTYGCLKNYAIRFGTSSEAQNAGILAIYRGSRYSGNQSLAFLAKGSGLARAGWTGHTRKIKNEKFKFYSVSGTGNGGIPLQVLSAPGQTIEIIPLQNYPGEYMDTLVRSPIGNRLIMWNVAWEIFTEHPWLGVGFGGFHQTLRQLILNNKVTPSVSQFQHPHNIYLNWLYGAGLLGVAGLLLLLAMPTLAANGSFSLRPAILALAVGAGLSGLTESLFIHSLWISWYVITIGILLSLDPDLRRNHK